MSNIDQLLTSTNLRHDPVVTTAEGSQSIYLHAGQLHVSPEAAEITTVLGSCIAVCLWDPIAGVGGMCHYMLPERIGGKSDNPRYASFAIPTLIDKIVSHGGLLKRLRAKVFGGGTMLNALSVKNDLGSKNATVAIEYLEDAGVPIVEQSVRGNHGRRVVFHTAEGHTEVRRVG